MFPSVRSFAMRRTVSGEFDLAVSAAEAIEFFTPEGERAWVPGWTPVYPSGESSETPGTVFTTDAGRRITIRQLRHSHATALLTAGVSPKVVQERLGHKSISVTMDVYSAVLPNMQREAVDRLAQVFDAR